MSRNALITVLGLTIATILGAWGFELIGGYLPCLLCYRQRWPYYAVILIGLPLMTATWNGNRPGLLRGGLLLLGAIMLVSAGLGLHHAGVEWRWWEGPAACAGGLRSGAASILPNLDNIQVASCTDPQWRLFGLSFAGYNALISLLVAAIAFWGASRRRP